MKRVFAILLNWNGAEDTLACIESINQLNLKNIDFNLVVVDNGSTDNSVELIQKLKSKVEVVIIQNKENLGFAGGNNVGIRYAIDEKADYILILNNDTLVHKDLIQSFVNVFEKDKKIGAATGKIYFAKGFEFHKDRYKENEKGKVIWSAGGDIDWKNVYGSNHGVDEVDKGQFDKLKKTDFVTGACSFFRVEALVEAGIYDEQYFLYLEDLELSERLKRKDWKLVFVPKSIVWHKVAQSSAIGSQLNDYFISRNRMLFGIGYASFRAKFALVRESLKLLFFGRKWQRLGIKDYYLGKYYLGSWEK